MSSAPFLPLRISVDVATTETSDRKQALVTAAALSTNHYSSGADYYRHLPLSLNNAVNTFTCLSAPANRLPGVTCCWAMYYALNRRWRYRRDASDGRMSDMD